MRSWTFNAREVKVERSLIFTERLVIILEVQTNFET